MASYFNLRGKVRAIVNRKGFKPISKIHPTRREAERWARGVEADMDRFLHVDKDSTTLGDLIDRYTKEVGPFGKNKKSVLAILKTHLGTETITTLTVERLVRYGKERATGGVTLGIDLSYLSALLDYATAVWKLPVRNPVLEARKALKHGKKLKRSALRERRPTADELDRIKAEYARTGKLKHPMSDIIDFAVATAMRAEEIARIRWADLDEDKLTIVIRDRKDPREKAGNDDIVPLLAKANEVIKRQPRTDARIFPYNHRSWSSTFPRICQRLGIEDLRFHDLRHEGISRLFELGYDIHEVAMFSGHRSWQQLKRYTQLRPANLRRLA